MWVIYILESYVVPMERAWNEGTDNTKFKIAKIVLKGLEIRQKTVKSFIIFSIHV